MACGERLQRKNRQRSTLPRMRQPRAVAFKLLNVRDGAMTKSGRIPCVVPFCRRTTACADFDEWICGDHWRLTDKPRRQVYGRYLRRWRRYGAAAYGPAASRIWRRLAAQAIQRAAGIG
jgi:hypothetical protein